MTISVIILSFNGEDTLPATLAAARRVSGDLHVVDSYSGDRSQEIARQYGAQVVEHPFETYGVQRKWASDHLPLKHDWELHLDQDDLMTDELVDELNRLKHQFSDDVTGYYIGRVIYFLGRPIRHGGMYPSWQMRLFRKGTGQCDKRRYDSHFYVTGPTRHLKGEMIDDVRMTLTEWTARHNKWADAEAEEIESPTPEGVIASKMAGDVVQRKRALRGYYEAWPLLIRPFVLFFYRYVLRLGFLDGKTGFVFYVLQTFWWRFLVDAKIFERRLARQAEAATPPERDPSPPTSASTRDA